MSASGQRSAYPRRSRLRAVGLAAALAGLAQAAPCAEAPAQPAAAIPATYAFVKDRPAVYIYDLHQDVEWESAGDKLAYTSTVLWKFVILPESVAAERVELGVTILRVQATHTGPGSRHVVDSGETPERSGGSDPLLGHLIDLEGKTLTVVVDPRSGAVAEVRGGEAIVAAINKRFPAPFPNDPPPLDADSRAAYSSPVLARMWSELLALPPEHGGDQQVVLGEPLAGTVVRRWSGSAYTVALPAGVDHLDAQLIKGATPVDASLGALDGKGQVQLKDGQPHLANGDLRFTLTLNALTQPVVQRHRIRWELRQVGGR